MVSLRQHIVKPMHTHHFNNGSLFGEETMAFNPFSSIIGKSREILIESQVEVEPSIVGICSTNKRGGVEENPFHCKRQRRKGCIPWEAITSVPEHDGYQWRKYGEKKIMNNQYTRCYYKCTYNKEYKCQATKQVQQQDNSDPPIYKVTYFYNHVCPSNNMSISCSNSKSQILSTNSQQILDFSAKTSPLTPQYHFVQEQNISKEINRARSPAAITSTVKEQCNNTEELSQSMDWDVKASEKEFTTTDLFSEEMVDSDFYEFNAMFYTIRRFEVRRQLI